MTRIEPGLAVQQANIAGSNPDQPDYSTRLLMGAARVCGIHQRGRASLGDERERELKDALAGFVSVGEVAAHEAGELTGDR